MRSDRDIHDQSEARAYRCDRLRTRSQGRRSFQILFFALGIICAGAGSSLAQVDEQTDDPPWEAAPDADAVIDSLRGSTSETSETGETTENTGPAWWELSIESEDAEQEFDATSQPTGSIDEAETEAATDEADGLEVLAPIEESVDIEQTDGLEAAGDLELDSDVFGSSVESEALATDVEDSTEPVVPAPAEVLGNGSLFSDDEEVATDDEADEFGGQDSAQDQVAGSAIADESSPFALFSLLTTLGAVSLAIAMALLAARMSRSLRATAGQWRSRFAVLESKLDRAETIFNAQPDLVIVWDEDSDVPAEGWGRPKVLGNPTTLATLLTYAEGSAGSTPVENILSGLATQAVEPGDSVSSFLPDDETVQSAAPNLIEAIQNLRWNGNGFSLIVKGFNGREIEVEGRPAGAQAVIWLTDITSKTRSVGGLREKLAQLSDESSQLRTFLDAAPFPVWRRNHEKKLS